MIKNGPSTKSCGGTGRAALAPSPYAPAGQFGSRVKSWHAVVAVIDTDGRGFSDVQPWHIQRWQVCSNGESWRVCRQMVGAIQAGIGDRPIEVLSCALPIGKLTIGNGAPGEWAVGAAPEINIVIAAQIPYRCVISSMNHCEPFFTDPVIRGMSLFHRHLLNHEDKGMMAKILFE